ncbi:MAG TPA: pyridoxamine 5'-phosphate oxidase family protein [Candidatus Saccharimonadales bacterium]|nr:pyridoxamine 5'-phosphate oxidase family protein [Candidatus Saccharimonadales bacterium]
MSAANEPALTAFLQARLLCTLATVTAAGRPQAAFVAYVSNARHEIIIGTSNQSRKFKNLTHNKSVALVIADETGEVQYEGQVGLITLADYEALLAAGDFQQLAGFDKYRHDPDQVYLKIKPTWIRFIVHGEPDQVHEFTEFA